MIAETYSSSGGPSGGEVEGVRAATSDQPMHSGVRTVAVQLDLFLVAFIGVEELLLILSGPLSSEEEAVHFCCFGAGRGLFSLTIGLSFVAQGSFRGMVQKLREGVESVRDGHGGHCLVVRAYVVNAPWCHCCLRGCA